MDKSLIYKAIESGNIANNISVSQLEEIRSSFPYFSIAQILLAKAYQENNDYRYTDQLHEAAIYSSDRKVLFDRLTRKRNENGNENENENGHENGNVNGNENENENENENVNVNVNVNENENENGNGNVNENENENELVSENGNIDEERPQTYGEWMMWKANRLRTPEKTNQNTDKLESDQEETFDEPESNEAQASIEINQKADLGILDKFILAEAVDSSIELEVGEDIENENGNGNDHVVNPKIAEQQDLIDKFIRAQPKIAPGRANDYPIIANLGKESMEEDFTFATETMAKLFIKQGKIDKARKVYKQLIALYPEKSIYFAAQLKNLNQYKK